MGFVGQFCKVHKEFEGQRVIFLVDDLEQLLQPCSVDDTEAARQLRAGVRVIVRTLKYLARDKLIIPVFVNSAHYAVGDLFDEGDGVLQTIHLGQLSDEEFAAYTRPFGMTSEQQLVVKEQIGKRVCDLLPLKRALKQRGDGGENTLETVGADLVRIEAQRIIRPLKEKAMADQNRQLLRKLLDADGGVVFTGLTSAELPIAETLAKANIVALTSDGKLDFTGALSKNACKKILDEAA
jgi:hypothetical protein